MHSDWWWSTFILNLILLDTTSLWLPIISAETSWCHLFAPSCHMYDMYDTVNRARCQTNQTLCCMFSDSVPGKVTFSHLALSGWQFLNSNIPITATAWTSQMACWLQLIRLSAGGAHWMEATVEWLCLSPQFLKLSANQAVVLVWRSVNLCKRRRFIQHVCYIYKRVRKACYWKAEDLISSYLP